MTDQGIENEKKIIDAMSHTEMAALWRFAKSGHPYFDMTTPLAAYFQTRFTDLGGMTPEISKAIGW